MSDELSFDVFLSHSSADVSLVRGIASRLRADVLKVWFDEQLGSTDRIADKTEEGLKHSRVLVLCLSATAFGSEWEKLEASTFRFRDPLNKERRFIPLRLDDAPLKTSLSQYLYISWSPADREQAYARLLEACRPAQKSTEGLAQAAAEQLLERGPSCSLTRDHQSSPTRSAVMARAF